MGHEALMHVENRTFEFHINYKFINLMMHGGHGGNPLVSLVIRPPRSTYPENTGTTLTQELGGMQV